MAMPKRAPLYAAVLIAALVAGCGLGRDSGSDGTGVNDPMVAATVNGRPIYIEDVRQYALAVGLLEETDDLVANSDAFYQALDDLIERRLFAMEAEARGLDRNPHIRRQIEMARDAVLWSAIAEEIQETATDPEEIEQLYRDHARSLGRAEQISVRHIQFNSREEAEAARRRLDGGERFEALAFELSTDRDTAPEGGLMPWGELNDFTPAFRRAIEGSSVGQVVGPFEQSGRWHLMRIENRRAQDAESLEALRPAIVRWLIYRETLELRNRLEENARVERYRQPDGVEGGGNVRDPADADEAIRPAPAPTPGPDAPPFPFPMGPAGIVGNQTPTPAAPPAPAAQAPAPAPAPAPAAQDGVGGPAP